MQTSPVVSESQVALLLYQHVLQSHAQGLVELQLLLVVRKTHYSSLNLGHQGKCLRSKVREVSHLASVSQQVRISYLAHRLMNIVLHEMISFFTNVQHDFQGNKGHQLLLFA